jgi:hypothetical protein
LVATITIPAVSLWDFFNSNSDLVAQVSTCIDYPVSAFSQHNSVTIFIIFVVILQKENGGQEVETLVACDISNTSFSLEQFFVFHQMTVTSKIIR